MQFYQTALGNCYCLKLPKYWLRFKNKFIVSFITIFSAHFRSLLLCLQVKRFKMKVARSHSFQTEVVVIVGGKMPKTCCVTQNQGVFRWCCIKNEPNRTNFERYCLGLYTINDRSTSTILSELTISWDQGVRGILVRGVNAPLPLEAKKIRKIWLRNGAFWSISE